MSRRLGPEETKYWLLGHRRPFNIVLAMGIENWRPIDHFALPVVVLGHDGVPRWSEAASGGVVRSWRGPWTLAVEDELDQPVGRSGAPPWRLTIVDDSGSTVLLLTLDHAVADGMGGHAILTRLLEGKPLPNQGPSFEELLLPEAYPAPDTADEVQDWWSRRLTARFRALEPGRLAGLLPSFGPTRVRSTRLGQAAFEALPARCRQEKTTLHGAVAAALTYCGVASDRLCHVVNMRRFLPAAFSDAIWFAPSVVQTPVSVDGSFWDRARQARKLLATEMETGAAGDALAELPRTLTATTARSPGRPPLTITNTGRLPLPEGPHGRATWYSGLASANAGAPVLVVSGTGSELLLVSCTPEDLPPLPIEQIAQRLAEAVSA
jgi:hypothetical protein